MKTRYFAICLFIASLFLFACGDDAAEDNDDSNDTTNQSSDDSNDDDDNGDGDDDNDNGGGDDNGDDDFQFCNYICESASDCGTEANWECVDERCHWEVSDADTICSDNEDCVAFMSGWQDPCTGQDDCEGTQACIDYEGEGLCAIEEGEFVTCADMEMESLSKDLVGESGQTQVCARLEFECNDDGFCEEPCQSDADCDHPGVDTCVDGTCQCGSDAACDDVDHGDVCVDGLCGCSGDEFCIDAGYDVCE